jgi:hypothetical protein
MTELAEMLPMIKPHDSDCAVNRAPYRRPGPCDCGVVADQTMTVISGNSDARRQEILETALSVSERDNRALVAINAALSRSLDRWQCLCIWLGLVIVVEFAIIVW